MSTQELHALLNQGHSARGEGRAQDALQNFKAAVALAKKTGAMEELIHALKGQGQIDRDLGRVDVALVLYREAVEECRKLGDPLLLAHTVRHLADVHSDMDALAAAEPLYRESLSLYKSNLKTGVLNLANALRPFAILLESTGRSTEAKVIWSETRMLHKALDLREAVEECDRHL